MPSPLSLPPETPRPPLRGRGRPRGFDPATALDAALLVFWEQGYAGASLGDVTAVTGLHKPSLRAAFGDKEALFLAVLDRYWSGRMTQTRQVLEAAPTAADATAAFLAKVATNLSLPQGPRGCLRVNAALECGDAAPAAVNTALRTMRAQLAAAIGSRLRRGAAAGELPAGSDPATLAEAIVTVVDGLAATARAGAPAAVLRATAELVAARLVPQV